MAHSIGYYKIPSHFILMQLIPVRMTNSFARYWIVPQRQDSDTWTALKLASAIIFSNEFFTFSGKPN
jgi:hypothetical protein